MGAALAGTSLPLLGLEFKILSLIILAAALVWLVRRLGSVLAAAGRAG